MRVNNEIKISDSHVYSPIDSVELYRAKHNSHRAAVLAVLCQSCWGLSPIAHVLMIKATGLCLCCN